MTHSDHFGRRERLSGRAVPWILTAMTAAIVLIALWATRAINPLRGDSAEYLYFDPSRTVGYPAFLELVRMATGKVALAVPLQMVMLGGSLLLLGRSFLRFAARPGLTIGFQVLLLGQAGAWFAAAFLMTEAISTALVGIWCALLLRTIDAISLRKVAAFVAVATLATMVRPTFVVLFAGTAIVILAAGAWRGRGLAMAMMGAGLLISWAATPLAQLMVHGSAPTTSPLARGVLQHTLYCDQHVVPAGADAALVEEVAAPVRAYIATAPGEVREQLRRSYSTPLRFGSIIPQLGRRHDAATRSAVDPYLMPIAEQRVAANPGCYIASVIGEYLRMALFDTDPTAEDGRRASAFIAAHAPVEVRQYPVLLGDGALALRAARATGTPPSGLNPPRQSIDVVAKVPLIVLLPFRLLYGTAALIGMAAMVALFFRRRMDSRLQGLVPAAAAMGVAFHGALAITAAVEIGFFRYLMPLWPIVCTLVGMVAVALARGSSERVEPPRE